MGLVLVWFHAQNLPEGEHQPGVHHVFGIEITATAF
jgi:hypothetical protein